MTCFHPRDVLAVMALTLGACGARTGLLVPDVESAPDVPDVLDVPDVPDVPEIFDIPAEPGCLTGSFTLVARAADLILVVDRSGSMGQGLDGSMRGSAGSKWSILRGALASTLPVFQDRINVGALFYPEDGAASRTATCALANIPDVDIDPAPRTAPRVLNVFDATGPGGSTPTSAALLRAYTYFVRHPNRARARYLVLATDGGPNCNTSLNPSTCVCTGGPGGGGRVGCRGASDGAQCLDVTRTAAEIAQIAANPVTAIPTFVIGLAGEGDPSFSEALTAMAIAGGRPSRNALGQPSFYDVQRAGELTTAFTVIQNTIARCTFVTPSRPTATDGISLSLDGATVPFDPTHINGWDWTDRAFGELTLFGPACPLNASTTTTVTATVECHADGG